jgi:hypothetical protein
MTTLNATMFDQIELDKLRADAFEQEELEKFHKNSQKQQNKDARKKSNSCFHDRKVNNSVFRKASRAHSTRYPRANH